MRPGSAAPLLVSTVSTGLLCLLVGAHERRGRSDTKVECMATTARISHLVRDIYNSFISAVVTAQSSKHLPVLLCPL